MPSISRGFRRRDRGGDPSRLPPGQHLESGFPVLSAGPTPRVSTAEWSFAITGALDAPRRWSWDELRALEPDAIRCDIHCVTAWSKLDTEWDGISLDVLLDGVETDVLDLRGPIGGYFVWDSASGGPLLLVAGGSGVVPLMSIERNRRLAAPAIVSTLLLSARAPEDVLYAAELDGATLTYTRRAPAGWTGYDRRIDAAMLTQVAPPPEARPRCFVCGPTAFVERVSQDLVDLGHDSALVKTERFGATG